MSGYLAIGVDGALIHYPGDPTSDLIHATIGDWWDMVRLPGGLMGWVDDAGHLKPLERNVVGSLTLMALGARQMPYAGPVVITGWHPYDEIVPLDERREQLVRRIHQDVSAVLAGRMPSGVRPEFPGTVREAAEWVRAAPAPAVQFATIDLFGRPS